MGPAEIDPAEAMERIGTFLPLDVREREEFDGPLGRIPGSLWVPLRELASRRGELPSDRRLLVVCRSGRRSERACGLLRAAGLAATNLRGGMVAWNRAGLPVEHRPPASPAELRERMLEWLTGPVGPGDSPAARALTAALLAVPRGESGPSTAQLERLLAGWEEQVARGRMPGDADLALAAFRRWLAGLEGGTCSA